jgi:hypothetical protein
MSMSFRSSRAAATAAAAAPPPPPPLRVSTKAAVAASSKSITTSNSGTRKQKSHHHHHQSRSTARGGSAAAAGISSSSSSSQQQHQTTTPRLTLVLSRDGDGGSGVKEDYGDNVTMKSSKSSRGVKRRRCGCQWYQHQPSSSSRRVVLLFGFCIVQFAVLLSIQVLYASGWRRYIVYNPLVDSTFVNSLVQQLPAFTSSFWIQEQQLLPGQQPQQPSFIQQQDDGRAATNPSNVATSTGTSSTSTSTAASAWTLQRDKILALCGPLCNTTRPMITQNSLGHDIPNFGYFGLTTAPIDCPALFASTLLDEAGNFPLGKSPRQPPVEYLADYTMQGRAVLEDWYIRENLYFGQQAKQAIWHRTLVEEWKHAALQGKFDTFGNYQVLDRRTLYDALQRIAQIRNQSVLVLGSETPWVEALCLAAGARQVTTLEYGAIVSQHEQITTYTPATFRQVCRMGGGRVVGFGQWLFLIGDQTRPAFYSISIHQALPKQVLPIISYSSLSSLSCYNRPIWMEHWEGLTRLYPIRPWNIVDWDATVMLLVHMEIFSPWRGLGA